jgi:hypothetical protein
MDPTIKLRSRRSHGFCWIFRLVTCFLIFCSIDGRAAAEDAVPSIRYDGQTHVFRIVGAGMSYIFGVSEKGELQSLYRGQRLNADDPFHRLSRCPVIPPSIRQSIQHRRSLWPGAAHSFLSQILKLLFPMAIAILFCVISLTRSKATSGLGA